MSDKGEYAHVYFHNHYVGRVQPSSGCLGCSFVQNWTDDPVHVLEKGFWKEFDEWMEGQG